MLTLPIAKTKKTHHCIVNVKSYWLKVTYCEDRNDIKQVYSMMLNDLETYPQKSNLAMQVRHILHNTGVNDVWMLQGVGVGDTTGVLNVFKQRVRDNFIQHWNSDLQTSSRASTYILISDSNSKTYLDNINIVK